jgi:multimeric flavodoxin WrbA
MKLLIVHHAPTPNTLALRDALIAGARDDAIGGVRVLARDPLDTGADDLLAADGVLLLTPANFGYMSGLTKDLFDRTFLQVGGALGENGRGREASGGRKLFGLCVHGRYDTTGAVRSVLAVVAALPWRQAAPVLSVLGEVSDDDRAQAYELGATLAALVGD